MLSLCEAQGQARDELRQLAKSRASGVVTPQPGQCGEGGERKKAERKVPGSRLHVALLRVHISWVLGNWV